MHIVYQAMIFARGVHAGQFRAGTGNPYHDHLAEVAGITATAKMCTPAMLSVAWLHDCIEQQAISENELADLFGSEISQGVVWLTDQPKTTQADDLLARNCERLAGAPDWIQTIKCADIISNISSIILHEPNSAKEYLNQKQKQLAVLKKADPALRELAVKQIVSLMTKLV